MRKCTRWGETELHCPNHPLSRTKKQKPTINGEPFLPGGEGEIRTHGTLAGTLVFKTSTLNHSVTSPEHKLKAKWRRGRDSNPREDLRPPNDLANRPLEPLGYLSVLPDYIIS